MLALSTSYEGIFIKFSMVHNADQSIYTYQTYFIITICIDGGSIKRFLFGLWYSLDSVWKKTKFKTIALWAKQQLS